MSRQKASLAEELINARKDLERQSDTIVRIAKEKEELTQDKAELAVQLTASERENRSVQGDKEEKRVRGFQATRHVFGLFWFNLPLCTKFWSEESLRWQYNSPIFSEHYFGKVQKYMGTLTQCP